MKKPIYLEVTICDFEKGANMEGHSKTALVELVGELIFFVRGQKVMLSTDLARLYNVEPKKLVQAMKRNNQRFPPDFVFQLNKKEYEILKSQFVTSSWGGRRRAFPYAFTEQGVAMLSSVLHSQRAIQVNVAIMRTFVKLRRVMASNVLMVRKLDKLERKYETHDQDIKTIFGAIRRLMLPPEKPKRLIGFGR